MPVGQPILAVEGVTKRFGPNEVLKNVTLSIGAQEIRAICGENGAGKSTLVKVFTGGWELGPHNWMQNDLLTHYAHDPEQERAAFDMLKLCFDQLHAEGAITGRIMNVGLHPHVIGQPHRIAALREFVEYVRGKPQVWFPTREQIATWYLAEATHGRSGDQG